MNTFGPPLDPPEGVECPVCHEWEEDCTCPEPDPDTMPGGHDWRIEMEMEMGDDALATIEED